MPTNPKEMTNEALELEFASTKQQIKPLEEHINVMKKYCAAINAELFSRKTGIKIGTILEKDNEKDCPYTSNRAVVAEIRGCWWGGNPELFILKTKKSGGYYSIAHRAYSAHNYKKVGFDEKFARQYK